MRIALFLICCGALAQAPHVRAVEPQDLPQALRGLDLKAIDEDSRRRLREGELDHLVFYALQSTQFTSSPPIEPALSAKAAHEQGSIPQDAAARLGQFFTAVPTTPRHQYFRDLIASEAELHDAYRRAMDFLYEKEWASQSKSGAARRDFIAGLFQTRAHSSDTKPDANYGLHAGLTALKELRPRTRIRRVLIAGPGADIAPRSALDESHPPQSYQPYLAADSLLRLGLAVPSDLTIDCADLNPRVVDIINRFPQTTRLLHVPTVEGDADWQAYWQRLGTAIGGKRRDTIHVSRRTAQSVRAFRMNVLTQRPDPAAYDLVIATNILVYFGNDELGLAMANLAASLSKGGILVHNEMRPSVERWGRILGLPPFHARMVRLRDNPQRSLYDSVILHQKR